MRQQNRLEKGPTTQYQTKDSNLADPKPGSCPHCSPRAPAPHPGAGTDLSTILPPQPKGAKGVKELCRCPRGDSMWPEGGRHRTDQSILALTAQGPGACQRDARGSSLKSKGSACRPGAPCSASEAKPGPATSAMKTPYDVKPDFTADVHSNLEKMKAGGEPRVTVVIHSIPGCLAISQAAPAEGSPLGGVGVPEGQAGS